MKLVELRERINAVATEMSALHRKEDRSADEESRLDTLLAEFNELGPKIVKEEERAKAVEAADRMNESRGRQVPGGGQAKSGAEERQTIDRRSMGQRFAESEQVKAIRDFGGKRSQPFTEVNSFYHRTPQVEYHDGMHPQELRTLIHGAALPADMVRPDLLPGIYRGDLPTNDLRSVLINGTTTSDAITFIRENVFTNNAAGVPEATHTSAADETPVNASVKPESALTFEQVTAPVVTIAHWIPITRQTLQDASQLQTYVENRLLEGLMLEEAEQLLNGAGGNDLTGILQTTGIQDLDDTYFAGAAVTDAGENNELLNRILRGRTMVRTTGRARANFVVLNPADLEDIVTLTNADQVYYGAGPFGAGVLSQLWGLRVVEDEAMTAGFALVGDGRMAAVWDRMQSQIFIDTIDDQFIRNMLTILAEERVALTVFRPAAFALVEF